MSDRYSDDTSGYLSFDPNAQERRPTQGQEQSQRNTDPTSHGSLAASELRSEGLGPVQGQGKGQSESSHFGSHVGGDPRQPSNQSARPGVDHRDPIVRSSGSGGGQDSRQHDRQDQWLYGGGGQRDQAVGVPQERHETSGNSGMSPGPGPGAKPDDYDVRGDGGPDEKPPMTERMMGGAEKAVGKVTGSTGIYERGQQHKTGGY